MIDAAPLIRHEVMLGRSEQGRPILAWESGDPNAKRRVLVVGCIHGNEPAGIAIANAVTHARVPAGTDVWVVPDLNPDGVAANTRQNARGVDLNRNFPYLWQPLSGTFYSGARSLSERESRIAYNLIRRVRPTTSIWFHQHLNVVDESGGSVAIERRFASLTGLPLARLAREPGSVVGWENHVLPGDTAFVVELPAGRLGDASASRFARAVESIATVQ
jgi:murein peptide amidase A